MQVDTVYSADSIEFCPAAGYERYFTCGTYQLLDPVTGELAPAPGSAPAPSPSAGEGSDAPAPRVGRLLLYALAGTTPVEVQRLDTAAILDAKWAASRPELAVADAEGGVTRYTLASDLGAGERLVIADDTTLVLSLDHRPGHEEIAASLSSGELALVDLASGSVTRWHAHDFEPWITAWQGPQTLWSGGDDLALKRWDVRAQAPTFVKRKGFDGGVTTIAHSPHDEHLLAVGSYDAHLRLFDCRAPARPLLELEMPGGIWRTRWHHAAERRGDILNACMHGGFAVARIAEGGEQGEITTTFPGTLGYGADWCRLPPSDGGSLVATCSFYDHDLNVWRA
ncbi:unnamed protein product [Cutaneotrichosporon oleaginosum]